MTGPGTVIAATARRHRGPAATAIATLLGFGALSATRGDERYWAFAVVFAVLAPLVAWLDRRARLTTGLAWALAGLGVLHLCGGLLPPVHGPTFYETWLVPGVLKFDQAVHFYGSVVATLIAWQALAARRGTVRSAAAWGLAGGVLNELVEMGLSARLTLMRTGTITNTEWDLIFDAAGVLVAAAYVALGLAGRRASAREWPSADSAIGCARAEDRARPSTNAPRPGVR